jgi:hypothetical protein
MAIQDYQVCKKCGGYYLLPVMGISKDFKECPMQYSI